MPRQGEESPMGITGMWKGYVGAVKKRVLVIWFRPRVKNGDFEHQASQGADEIFVRVRPLLEKSVLDLCIIKAQATIGLGPVFATRTKSYVFERTGSGDWRQATNAKLLSQVIKAGL